MTVASFFAGCGGLDLGFRQAGFNVIWANEYDKTIHPTYRLNHPHTTLNTADIRQLSDKDIPDCDGFIGGPPCQSWSLGGNMRGLDDERGKLFLDYIRLIKTKQPKFFVIENVAGIISDKHFKTFHGFLSNLKESGYQVCYSLLNAADYGVPQNRIRVFVVGIRNDLNLIFNFPEPVTPKGKQITLRQAIGDITDEPRKYYKEPVSTEYDRIWNHDCYTGPYDSKFMARNRVKGWDSVSFTIQAQARNIPLHPQAPEMIYVSPQERRFNPKYLNLYRRLSVRECARIQTFPDSFHFLYSNILDGYKMIGNAVPPRLAKFLAIAMLKLIAEYADILIKKKRGKALVGYVREEQFKITKEKKIYYVRTGFRPGALQIPAGHQSPNYLILHRRNLVKAYKLKQSEPIVMYRDELEKLGFNPHGDAYLSFFLDDEVDIKQLLDDVSIIKTFNSKNDPFLIDL